MNHRSFRCYACLEEIPSHIYAFPSPSIRAEWISSNRQPSIALKASAIAPSKRANATLITRVVKELRPQRSLPDKIALLDWFPISKECGEGAISSRTSILYRIYKPSNNKKWMLQVHLDLEGIEFNSSAGWHTVIGPNRRTIFCSRSTDARALALRLEHKLLGHLKLHPWDRLSLLAYACEPIAPSLR